MVERMPNRTRSALIILMIALIVVLVVLAADFVGRMSAYSRIHSIEEEDDDGDRYYRNYDYDDEEEIEESEEIMGQTCAMTSIGAFIITVLFIIGASLLFGARNSYGPKHCNKAIGVFVLSIIAPTLPLIFTFLFEIFDVSQIGIIFAISICLFIIAMFLSNTVFARGPSKFIALIVGIGSTIPLLFVDDVIMDYDVRVSALKTACILMMITDVGLIVGLSFYVHTFWESLRYTKANPPSSDNLQLRLMNQQSQQLKMEVEILRLQKQQMELLADIKQLPKPQEDVKFIAMNEEDQRR